MTDKKLESLDRVVRAVTAERALAREVRNLTIEALKNNNERFHQTKQAVLELARLTPSIAWETTNVYAILNNYAEGLSKIRASCSHRRLSMDRLSKVVKLPEFRLVMERDVYIDEIAQLDARTVSLSLYVDIARKDTFIFQLLSFKHWVNLTSEPAFVQYAGPDHAILNSELDCLRGVPKPEQRQVYEVCDTKGYRDPALSRWEKVDANEEEIKAIARPATVVLESKIIIYCMYHNISVQNLQAYCPRGHSSC